MAGTTRQVLGEGILEAGSQPPGPKASPAPGQVVGRDRDLHEVAGRLAVAGSVILVGPLGSGKSHFSHAVVEVLRARGIVPVVVRAAAPLRSIPFGALKAAADPRLDRLWDGGEASANSTSAAPAAPTSVEKGDPSFVIVVDDAHALDAESIDLLGRAIYTRQARVLLSVTADPIGSHVVTTPQAIIDLWLHGGAERYDLHPLEEEDAEALMDAHGGAVLDSVTRAVLVARAAGSRILLRELTSDAIAEFAAGRDPLDPDREEEPGSRLSDAVAQMLGEYSTEQRLALAVIGRLRGIGFATACRSIEPSVLENLIKRRALRTDEAGAPALFANPLLAEAAENRLDPGVLDAALDRIATRALKSPEVPAGRAVDRLIAANWLSQRDSVPGPSEVEPATRCRILSSAARSANSVGRADLALAYEQLGLEAGGCPALRLEASRAHARLRQFDEALAAITAYRPSDLGTDDLRRLVRWAGSLSTWLMGDAPFTDLDAWLDDEGIDDPGARVEVVVRRTIEAGLQLEWAEVVRSAATVLSTPGAHPRSRHGAAIVSGVAFAEIGRPRESRATFAEAARMNRDPVTGLPLSISRELLHLCFEAFAALLADPGGPEPAHPGDLFDRLQTAIRLAAEHDDRAALGIGGLATGIITGVQRDDVSAAREFTAALKRFGSVEFAVWRPLVVYFQAGSLARLGKLAQASAVMSRVDDRLAEQFRLLRFVRSATEAELAAAAGDLATAAAAASVSVELRSRTETGERLPDFEAIHFERILQLASDALARSDNPAEGGVDASPEPPAGRDSSVLGANAEPAELTDREHQVALLVARQLSNKEIAQQLYLSVRTVESHIYTARGKLNARSRRELGRLVVENDTYRP